MTSDPLVAAVAQLLARHHTGCNQPVQPAPWMTAAAEEIAAAINSQVFPETRWAITAALEATS